jgi:hypothetical protein
VDVWYFSTTLLSNNYRYSVFFYYIPFNLFLTPTVTTIKFEIFFEIAK